MPEIDGPICRQEKESGKAVIQVRSRASLPGRVKERQINFRVKRDLSLIIQN